MPDPRLILAQAAAIVGLCLLFLGSVGAQEHEADAWQTALRLARGGQQDAALPLIERLVSDNPSNAEYRFELAYLLYEAGRDGRARHHLQQVRGADLTPAERRLVDQLIGQIEERRVWSGYFGIDLRPESNGTKQTDQQTITIGGLPFTLSGSAIGQPTVSTIVTAGAAFTPQIAPGLKGRLSVDAYLKHNAQRILRDHVLTFRAGMTRRPDARSLIGGGVIFGLRRIADAPYSQTAGIYGDMGRSIGTRGVLHLSAEAARAHRRSGAPRIDRVLVAARYQHALTAATQVSFSGFAERAFSAQGNLAGTRLGASITGQAAFAGGLVTGLTLRAERDGRNGIEPIFGVARSDRKVGIDLRLHHRDITLGGFAPQIVLGVERNRSNIALADYRNSYISLGLTRNF